MGGLSTGVWIAAGALLAALPVLPRAGSEVLGGRLPALFAALSMPLTILFAAAPRALAMLRA